MWIQRHKSLAPTSQFQPGYDKKQVIQWCPEINRNEEFAVLEFWAPEADTLFEARPFGSPMRKMSNDHGGSALNHIELQTPQQALQSKKRINSSIIQVCYWRVQLHHYGLWQWECYKDLLRLPRSTTRWMQHYQDLGHCQGFFHPPVSKKTWKGGSNMLIGDNTTNYLLTILSQSLWWLPKKSLCTSTLPCIDAKCRQNNGTPPPPTRKFHLYNIPIPMYAQALRV